MPRGGGLATPLTIGLCGLGTARFNCCERPAVPGSTPPVMAHTVLAMGGPSSAGAPGHGRPLVRFRTRPAVHRFKREMTSGANIGNGQGVNVLGSRGYAGACVTEPRFGAASEVLSFLQGAEAP
jgi:hypothetical protein